MYVMIVSLNTTRKFSTSTITYYGSRNTRKVVPHFRAISVFLWTLHLRHGSNKLNLFSSLILGNIKECLSIGLYDSKSTKKT